MSDLLLTDEKIRATMVKTYKDGQLYGDDREPLPEKAIAQAQHDEILAELKRIDLEELKGLPYSKLRALTIYEEKIRALIARMEQE